MKLLKFFTEIRIFEKGTVIRGIIDQRGNIDRLDRPHEMFKQAFYIESVSAMEWYIVICYHLAIK